MAFKYRKEAEDKGYTDKPLLRYIVRKMFNKESFVGKFTRGGLSNQNLIISLLKWPLDKK